MTHWASFQYLASSNSLIVNSPTPMEHFPVSVTWVKLITVTACFQIQSSKPVSPALLTTYIVCLILIYRDIYLMFLAHYYFRVNNTKFLKLNNFNFWELQLQKIQLIFFIFYQSYLHFEAKGGKKYEFTFPIWVEASSLP